MPASSGLGPSARSRHHAVAAIIAPLSVQSSSGTRNARRPVLAASSATRAAQRGVRGHPTPDRHGAHFRLVGDGEQLVDELVDDGFLERRRDVGNAIIRVTGVRG